jgi:bifunctional DNA-binding transcriptional regulator/antitoxin component of YhaV-PrlF toxin-antitoxin module
MSADALPLPPTCTDFPFLVRRVRQGVYEIDLLPRHARRERLLAIARRAHSALPHLKLCLGLRPGVFVYFTEDGEHSASLGPLGGLRFVRQVGADQPYRETGALAERRQRLWEEVAREREADEMAHVPVAFDR